MKEFEKEILDKLMSNGEVEIRGLQHNAMCNFVYTKVLLTNPGVWGVIVYEARKENGFFRDTTNAHLVNVGATFVPYFHGEHTLVTRNNDDYNTICDLEPFEVKPPTKEEMEELAKILKKWNTSFNLLKTQFCSGQPIRLERQFLSISGEIFRWVLWMMDNFSFTKMNVKKLKSCS